MRDDIDPKSIVPVHLIARGTWMADDRTMHQAGDYDGYRACTRADGKPCLFLALPPGGLQATWVDITDQANNFIVFHKQDVATRLAQKLGLSQSPSVPTMKQYAKRTRTLVTQGHKVDIAAMMAAKETFEAEFQPNRYAGVNHSMEALLSEIDKL